MFREKDLHLLKTRGITPEAAAEQINRFKTGFPYLRISAAATPGNGIAVLTPAQEEEAIQRWDMFLKDGGEVCKFVPASGAASRMFKALFEYADGDSDALPEGHPVTALLADTSKLPFETELDAALRRIHGKDLKTMLAEGRNRDIIAAIIRPEGMNYGALPKALLKFHKYADKSRTPLEEHLTEGVQTAANSSNVVNLHFTVSANHRRLFEDKLSEAVPAVEKSSGVKFHISLSEQKPSTDTIAVNPDNTPFLEDDNLFFRPGGHGALIENLNDIDAAVVFIKNIDNVVPENRREDTIRYKKIIAGTLILIHDEIARYLEILEKGTPDEALLNEMVDFMSDKLSTKDEALAKMSADEKAAWLKAKFNRPIRVAGMVRNEGEPGGGPYIAYNADGSMSPQVLESTQIDMSNDEYRNMMTKATHFNPVDLVCYVKDIHGKPFDLPKYVDPSTGFISSKSSHGRELRAMELPGLWNGAMSDWNTIFVEVPLSTFNPVKTVNDLLRPMHQG